MTAPDRRLRRMVAQLSAMTPQDHEAILQDLDGGQRARLEALLAQFEPAPAALPRLDPQTLPDGISPWLAERFGLGAEGAPAVAGHGMMTAHAVAALHASARALDPPPLSALRPVPGWSVSGWPVTGWPVTDWPGTDWLGRLLRRLSGRESAKA